MVVDVTSQAAADRDYQVSVEDFESWEADHGKLPDDIIVLIQTGFGRFWPDREAYMGTAERGEPGPVAREGFRSHRATDEDQWWQWGPVAYRGQGSLRRNEMTETRGSLRYLIVCLRQIAPKRR